VRQVKFECGSWRVNHWLWLFLFYLYPGDSHEIPNNMGTVRATMIATKELSDSPGLENSAFVVVRGS
jgi:hypothetical protein